MQNAQSPMQKPEAKNKDNYDFKLRFALCIQR